MTIRFAVTPEKFANLQKAYDLLAKQKQQLIAENKIKDEAITRLLTKYERMKDLVTAEKFQEVLKLIEDEQL